MTDTRHPGPITPDNAPRLADLDDDDSLMPTQITMFCDNCGLEHTNDYLVTPDADRVDRYEIAKAHLRTLGWRCGKVRDFCPECAPAQVLAEVRTERLRQLSKWGVQHRRDGVDPHLRYIADNARKACQAHEIKGGATWNDVLSEEYYEAITETDLAKLRAELVQVAAVCVAWIEDIDSRTKEA